jgi:uncharacterized protein (DUF2252 family)
MTQRADYIINTIKTYHSDLIESNPEAIKNKFEKMSHSPFNFYRGTAHLFYADMKQYPSEFINEKTGKVWIQGDLHIGNFGTYKDSKGDIVYDVNDYDECYLAPFIWDIWRAAASIIFVVRQQKLTDIPERDFVFEYARAFYEKICQFAKDASERDFKIDLEHSEGHVQKTLERAQSMSRLDLLNKRTEIYRGIRRFKFNEIQKPLKTEHRNKIVSAFYEQYIPSIPLSKLHDLDYYTIQSIDMVEVNGVGIGSAGQKMFTFLIRGESDSADDDIVIITKVARPSVVMPYVNTNPFPEGHIRNEAMRCILGQRAMQVNADPLLGHFEYNENNFYACELSPYEENVNLDEIHSSKEFLSVLSQMGQATAKIHAISDRDADASLVPYSADKEISGVIAGREEQFLNEVCDFALSYAKTVEDDYKVFLEALRNEDII